MARSNRIHLLDEIRGFMIICMVLFHAFYTMGYIFGMDIGITLLNFFAPAEPFFAAGFILISGFCSRLGHSNLKRGGRLLLIALLLTLVTYLLDRYCGMEGTLICFGILHLLSICMLLYALCERFISRINAFIGVIICILLFAFTFNIDKGMLGFGVYTITLPAALQSTDWLAPLGLHSASFYSADYFPILPWLFVFFAGSFLGVSANRRLPKFCYNQHIRPLAYCGRHTLIIYIVHQPVIYGLVWLLHQIFS